MSLIASSAGYFSDPDFWVIFAPRGYDDPEILPSRNPRRVSKALKADSICCEQCHHTYRTETEIRPYVQKSEASAA